MRDVAVDAALESMGTVGVERRGPTIGIRSTMLEAAIRDPEMARAMIAEQGMEPFSVGLIDALEKHRPCYSCGCKGQHPWAYRLFAQVVKLVGVAPSMVDEFLKALGVSTLVQAKGAVRTVQNVESMSVEDIEADAVAHLQSRGWTCVGPKAKNGKAK